MEKIYKSKIYRMLFNLLCGIALSFFVFYIAQIWLSPSVSIITAIILFIFYVWLIIWGNFITIILNEKELIVKKGKKENRYEFSKYRFRAKTVSSRNDTECTLYAIDENGKETIINCELIGIGQFRHLMNDLKLVIGEEINRLDTIKKEK